MILGTSYRDHRGALVATDKVEKRDGSFFHVGNRRRIGASTSQDV